MIEREELWKDIPGYEGHYQVSELGNVRSLDRTILYIRRGENRTMFLRGIVLKPILGSCNYLTVSLSDNNSAKTYRVHQLVAMAFLGHTPCGYKLVVNHKNFDRTDNRVENLEIVTMRENGNMKHLKSSSKYTGVTWQKHRNCWRAHIYINGKQLIIGSFKCELAAAKAYQDALNAHNNRKEIPLHRAVYTSKYPGVWLRKRKNRNPRWEAYIRIDGKQRYLGAFKTELEAHQAYQDALDAKNLLIF